MNKRISMQALAGVFALGVGTAMAGPEATRPADPAQPMRPSAGSTAPTPTPTPPAPTPSPGTTTGSPSGTLGAPPPTGTAGTTVAAPAGVPLTDKESKQAKKVLTDIHNVNALEITLGRLAQQKAESQSIKDYAQMLVTDHEAADKKVMDFASANNIMLTSLSSTTTTTTTTTTTRTGTGPAATGAQGTTGTATTTAGTNPAAGTGNTPATATPPTSDITPIELTAADQRTVTKLEKLEGIKFEKAFLTEMVRGHQKTLGKVKGAEKSAKNAELKALLGDISASVQMHLDKAKELQRAGSASLGSTNVPN
jgi:predicted outer membrane protein